MKNKKVMMGVLIGIAAAAYMFLPIDVVPDVVLGLGQIDDIAVVGVAVALEIINAKKGLGFSHEKIKDAAAKTVDVVKGGSDYVGTGESAENNTDYVEGKCREI